MKLVLSLCLALFLSGCAYMRSTTSKYNPATGENEKTTVRCYTLFDSQSALAKFRNTTGASASNGFVFPPGTSIGSLEQSSSSTNLDQLIGVIVGAAVKAAVKP